MHLPCRQGSAHVTTCRSRRLRGRQKATTAVRKSCIITRQGHLCRILVGVLLSSDKLLQCHRLFEIGGKEPQVQDLVALAMHVAQCSDHLGVKIVGLLPESLSVGCVVILWQRYCALERGRDALGKGVQRVNEIRKPLAVLSILPDPRQMSG